MVSEKDIQMIKETKKALDLAKAIGTIPMSNMDDMLSTWKDSSHCFEIMHCEEELKEFNKDFKDKIDSNLYRGIALGIDFYEKHKENLLEVLNDYHKEGINSYCSSSKNVEIAKRFTHIVDNDSLDPVKIIVKITGDKYLDVGYNEIVSDDEQEVIVKNPKYVSIEKLWIANNEDI